MRFHVRPPFGVEPFDLDLDDQTEDYDEVTQMTVRELRDRLRQESAGLAALGDGDQLRLVFGGRVLAGADVPLADYGACVVFHGCCKFLLLFRHFPFHEIFP